MATYNGNTLSSTSINSNYNVIQGISKDDAITIACNNTLMVNDRDILKELDEMRDALLLLKRDVKMEEKYPRLKELKDEYEAALEKYKTFDTIKESK